MEQPSAKPNRRWPRRRPKRTGERAPAIDAAQNQAQPGHLIVPARPDARRSQAPRPPAPERQGSTKRPNTSPNGSAKPSSGRREPARGDGRAVPGGHLPAARPEAARHAPVAEPSPYSFKLGARVRLCDALRQRGSHGRTGVIVWVGNLVDVRWEDGVMSYMLPPGLLEAVEEKPETAEREAAG